MFGPRPGTTLLELIVVLAIIALATSLVTVTMQDDLWARYASDVLPTGAAQVRRQAVIKGMILMDTLREQECVGLVTAFPDGRVLLPSCSATYSTTGRVPHGL